MEDLNPESRSVPGGMSRITLDLYGRQVRVARTGQGWSVLYLGVEGKSRPASDIVVPSFVTEAELECFLADLCHEWATKLHPVVKQLT